MFTYVFAEVGWRHLEIGIVHRRVLDPALPALCRHSYTGLGEGEVEEVRCICRARYFVYYCTNRTRRDRPGRTNVRCDNCAPTTTVFRHYSDRPGRPSTVLESPVADKSLFRETVPLKHNLCSRAGVPRIENANRYAKPPRDSCSDRFPTVFASTGYEKRHGLRNPEIQIPLLRRKRRFFVRAHPGKRVVIDALLNVFVDSAKILIESTATKSKCVDKGRS